MLTVTALHSGSNRLVVLVQANVLIMLQSHCWRIIDLGIAAQIGALLIAACLLGFAVPAMLRAAIVLCTTVHNVRDLATAVLICAPSCARGRCARWPLRCAWLASGSSDSIDGACNGSSVLAACRHQHGLR